MIDHYQVIQAYFEYKDEPKIKFIDHRFHTTRAIPVKGDSSLLVEITDTLKTWGYEIIGFGTAKKGYCFFVTNFKDIKEQ